MARKMTRKELIGFCVDDQIARGVVSPSRRSFQISARLKGCGAAKAMSYDECVRWYEAVIAEKAAL